MASALAKSDETLNPPVIIKEMSFTPRLSKNFLARYNAKIVGIEVDSLINLDAAAVAPGLPSIVIKSRY